ncbi:Apical membrane antigen 1 [Theileria orientalis]|uniref:Apical membrane antigen 1 n=1 Tax=Theileria orientalis TaxID=68886 RepID=A0A976QUM1_THEOR|nr:Apical membrane antigen 1 [Theileria orientalis]
MTGHKDKICYSKEDNNHTSDHSGVPSDKSFIYQKNENIKSVPTPTMITTTNSNNRYFDDYYNNLGDANEGEDAPSSTNYGTSDAASENFSGYNERCVGPEEARKFKEGRNCASKSTLSRIAKSLSLLFFISSLNLGCLALDSLESTTRSVHPGISLLQGESGSLLSSSSTMSSVNSTSMDNNNDNSSHMLESTETEGIEVSDHNGSGADEHWKSGATNLIEMKKKVSFNPFNKLSSFIQLALSSASTLGSRATSRGGLTASKDKKKRTGGNRRLSKKKTRDDPEEKRTKWTDYMAKFDIAKVHGSGVYVDLGGYATVGSYDYRMPTGKCPVVGKAIVLENGADFLKSITHHDVKERGLAFPATKVSTNSSKADMENQLLSPISAQVLRSWNYKHESDLSNCAEYSKNIVPGSNRNSKYRYPFVYDQTDKLCYILYSPMQYNQGVKYCDTDSADEGTSSLACMYPDKDKEDSHLFYGTSSLHMDWNVVCPVYPIRDAIFGTYDQENDECVAIEPIYVEDSDDYSECSKILFEYSPSDVDVSSNNQTLSDVDRYKEAMETGKLSTALSIMFSPRYSEDRPIYTKGVGINWATYNVEEKKCNILDEVPTCLIIRNGNYALTSLSSPNEEDAVPYPCDIKHGKGYVKNKKKKKETGESAKEGKEEKKEKEKDKEEKEGKEKEKEMPAASKAEEFIPYTSLKTDGFSCDKFVHTVPNGSCGSYLECNTTPPQLSGRGKKILMWVLIGLSIAIAVAVGGFLFYKYFWAKRFKKYHSETYEDDLFYDSEHEYNNPYNLEGQRANHEYNVNNEEGIWSRNEPNNSDVTPVRISRLEAHN